MTVLDQTVRFEQLIAFGASELYNERQLRKWFGDADSITIRQALKTKTHVSRVLWLIMREEFVPARLMHLLAFRLCRYFLERLATDGIYLDYRLPDLLRVKEQWAVGAASRGELTVAQHVIHQVSCDLAGHHDERARLAADGVFSALVADPSLSVRNVFYTYIKVYEYDANSEEFRTRLEEYLCAESA